MKQVLLAINTLTPSKQAFRYAVDLSRRIRAELSILRILDKERLAEHFSVSREKAASLGRSLEDAFAQVAFAEEGLGGPDPLRTMLSGSSFDTAAAGGNKDPDADLKQFVDIHHDVVLTILDSAAGQESPNEKKARINKLKKKLGVPLVVIRPGRS